MKHYLIIGHAAFYEEEWRHMKFDDEQPTKLLKQEYLAKHDIELEDHEITKITEKDYV